LPELGRLGGDDQVTGHRQLAAAAETKPGDRRNEWRPQGTNCIPALDPPLVVKIDRGGTGELADVGARGEGSLVSAEDDAADSVVAVELRQPGDKLVHQLVRERIQLLGPVQPEDRNRVVTLEKD